MNTKTLYYLSILLFYFCSSQLFAQNLLKNGSWEENFKYFNTGNYEPRKQIFWGAASASATIDKLHKKRGRHSLKITNYSKPAPHVYRTMCQRIENLAYNTNYYISFWVKAKNAKAGCFAIIFDLPWKKKVFAPEGTYDWKKVTYVYNTGQNNFIDFRLLTENTGTVWVDAMVVSSKVIDTDPPTITITNPDISRGFIITEQNKQIIIQGKATDESGIFEVFINGQEAYTDAQGNFSKTVLLAIGDNSFTVTATDLKQNTTTKKFVIVRKSIQQIVNNQINNSDFQAGKNYALIIGVQDYIDQSISDLDQPVPDAQTLYNVLVSKYTFELQNVKFLKNPTKNEITDVLDFYSDNLTESDNLLIFYAGHGYWDKKFKQGYWLAADANRNKRGTWLSNGIIRDYMQGIPAKHSLLITDACFGGGIFKSRDAFADASIAVNQLYKLPSRKAMTSGALSEVPDKSVFIEYLVKRLKQNTEKYLSSEQLFASFKIAVINNSENGQVPQFGEVKSTGDEGGDFIFIQK